jgi:hypothetical protein
MPAPLLNAYAAQLPGLVAEESLLAATRVAVGSGSLRKGEGRRLMATWSRTAGQGHPAPRPKGPAEYAARMAVMGIGVKRTRKASPEEPPGG